MGACSYGKPTLFISNHLAWDFYQKVQSQVIVAGMGEVLGIRFEAIDFLMNLYGIMKLDERRDLFEKIMLVDGIRAKRRSQELITKKQTETTKKK